MNLFASYHRKKVISRAVRALRKKGPITRSMILRVVPYILYCGVTSAEFVRRNNRQGWAIACAEEEEAQLHEVLSIVKSARKSSTPNYDLLTYLLSTIES